MKANAGMNAFFNESLLSISCVLSIVLGTGDRVLDKTDEVSALMELLE